MKQTQLEVTSLDPKTACVQVQYATTELCVKLLFIDIN
jgi:hypothetical protein